MFVTLKLTQIQFAQFFKSKLEVDKHKLAVDIKGAISLLNGEQVVFPSPPGVSIEGVPVVFVPSTDNTRKFTFSVNRSDYYIAKNFSEDLSDLNDTVNEVQTVSGFLSKQGAKFNRLGFIVSFEIPDESEEEDRAVKYIQSNFIKEDVLPNPYELQLIYNFQKIVTDLPKLNHLVSIKSDKIKNNVSVTLDVNTIPEHTEEITEDKVGIFLNHVKSEISKLNSDFPKVDFS